MKKFNLEERLIEFSVKIIELIPHIPKTIIGQHLSKQLLRSGTSPALQYGEAQSAESRADFIHKMKVGLKELRESLVCLKIILRAKLIKEQFLTSVIKECDELISIFVKSCHTAKLNLEKEKLQKNR